MEDGVKSINYCGDAGGSKRPKKAVSKLWRWETLG
jgi:hypothetical protein